MTSSSLNTPMMRQYLSIKETRPDDILFFRMGDFYEMFLEDAVYASRVLDIALTKRGDHVPMCGIPYHAWQNYVIKILKSGKNIAICEQVEDPKTVQNRIVKREVTRIITPGTIFEEELLDKASQSLLASVFPCDDETLSLAMADLSTGEIWLDILKNQEVENYLHCRDVLELLTTKDLKDKMGSGALSLQMREYHVTQSACEKLLKEKFQIGSLAPLELSLAESVNLYRLSSYTEEIAPRLEVKWQRPFRAYTRKSMQLDETALQTLEILKDQEGGEKASLFSVLDQTKTAAGKRLLKDMLLAPSVNQQEIEKRYSLVDFFMQDSALKKDVQRILGRVKDAVRVLNHLRYSPKVHHLGSLLQTLEAFDALRSIFQERQRDLHPYIKKSWLESDFPQGALTRLQETLVVDELPPLLDERRFVRQGFSEKLDELFHLSGSAHQVMREFEKREQKKWKLPTLKVRYNKVIGYYIEISKALAGKAPEHYLRRQTLTNSERFTLQELSDLESSVLNAKENIIREQGQIFDEITEYLLSQTNIIWEWARKVSFLDVMVSFAEAAIQNKYTRPIIKPEGELKLKDSRHPVVEALFKEEVFVPNDAHFNQSERHLAILTGPNMSGKSTYIRQIGLIQIMAQTGSFIPASYAELPLVDRIFTRIGAYDRLFKGESTFFVEMLECAKIFQNYTSDSLILLDEVGRGTSTFDGVSIARAMLEFLNQDKTRRAKTLFATHFAELSDLINQDKGIFGLTVQVVEEKNKITFLRKIKEGVASKSYGIYVAKLAGIPDEITIRAHELLQKLEKKSLWSASPLKNQDEVKLKSAAPSVKNGDYPARSQQNQSKNKDQDQLAMF